MLAGVVLGLILLAIASSGGRQLVSGCSSIVVGLLLLSVAAALF